MHMIPWWKTRKNLVPVYCQASAMRGLEIHSIIISSSLDRLAYSSSCIWFI